MDGEKQKKLYGCLLLIGVIASILMVGAMLRYQPYIDKGVMYRENFIYFVLGDIVDILIIIVKFVYSNFIMRLIYMVLGVVAIVYLVKKM